jgi:hypothetical protein
LSFGKASAREQSTCAVSTRVKRGDKRRASALHFSRIRVFPLSSQK